MSPQWEQSDSDEALDDLIARTGSSSTKGYDVATLQKDVEHDLAILEGFASRAETVRAASDPKLDS